MITWQLVYPSVVSYGLANVFKMVVQLEPDSKLTTTTILQGQRCSEIAALNFFPVTVYILYAVRRLENQNPSKQKRMDMFHVNITLRVPPFYPYS